MNRETIIKMAREAGLAEVTDTNQNLRQAEQALLKRYAELVNSGDAGNWYQEAELEVIAARQALALPTAEQVDDINVAESFTSVTKTAAPVCEREAFEREMSKPPFEFCMDRWPDDGSYAWPGNYAAYYAQCAWVAWQARASLSAGDAVDEPQSTPIACAVHVAGRTFEKGVPFCDVIDYIESNTTRWVASSDRYPPEGERVFFMNRETIIQMAREAGFDFPSEGDCFDYPLEFERFYALAVAKERDECAKVCNSTAWTASIDEWKAMTKKDVAEQSMHACAAAIRARGDAV